MWQDDNRAKTVRKTWERAKRYCQNLSHGGYDDWYLPSISELETLSDTTKYNPAKKKGFKNVSSSIYWSSSSCVPDSKYAWVFTFRYGSSSNSGDKIHDRRYIRCARAGENR